MHRCALAPTLLLLLIVATTHDSNQSLQRGSGNSLVSIDLPVRVFREVKLTFR